MRTAEEIIRDTFDAGTGDELIADLYIKAVNEARIEAIKECAALIIFEPMVAKMMLKKITELK